MIKISMWNEIWDFLFNEAVLLIIESNENNTDFFMLSVELLKHISRG